MQLLGAVAFEVSCVYGLPGMIDEERDAHAQEVAYVYYPSLIGSVAFTFASYIFPLDACACAHTHIHIQHAHTHTGTSS